MSCEEDEVEVLFDVEHADRVVAARRTIESVILRKRMERERQFSDALLLHRERPKHGLPNPSYQPLWLATEAAVAVQGPVLPEMDAGGGHPIDDGSADEEVEEDAINDDFDSGRGSSGDDVESWEGGESSRFVEATQQRPSAEAPSEHMLFKRRILGATPLATNSPGKRGGTFFGVKRVGRAPLPRVKKQRSIPCQSLLLEDDDVCSAENDGISAESGGGTPAVSAVSPIADRPAAAPWLATVRSSISAGLLNGTVLPDSRPKASRRCSGELGRLLVRLRAKIEDRGRRFHIAANRLRLGQETEVELCLFVVLSASRAAKCLQCYGHFAAEPEQPLTLVAPADLDATVSIADGSQLLVGRPWSVLQAGGVRTLLASHVLLWSDASSSQPP